MKVKDGEVSRSMLVCPEAEGPCKTPLTAHDIEGVLADVEGGAELWKKFDEFRLEGYVQAEDTSHHCPGAGCGYVLRARAADLAGNKFGPCPRCKGTFCMECKEKWHEGSCEEAAAGLPSNLKKCPKCGHYVEKAEGCNAIVCRCGIVPSSRSATSAQSRPSAPPLSAAPAGQRMTPDLCQGCDANVLMQQHLPPGRGHPQRLRPAPAQAAQHQAGMAQQYGAIHAAAKGRGRGQGHVLGGGLAGVRAQLAQRIVAAQPDLAAQQAPAAGASPHAAAGRRRRSPRAAENLMRFAPPAAAEGAGMDPFGFLGGAPAAAGRAAPAARRSGPRAPRRRAPPARAPRPAPRAARQQLRERLATGVSRR